MFRLDSCGSAGSVYSHTDVNPTDFWPLHSRPRLSVWTACRVLTLVRQTVHGDVDEHFESLAANASSVVAGSDSSSRSFDVDFPSLESVFYLFRISRLVSSSVRIRFGSEISPSSGVCSVVSGSYRSNFSPDARSPFTLRKRDSRTLDVADLAPSLIRRHGAHLGARPMIRFVWDVETISLPFGFALLEPSPVDTDRIDFRRLTRLQRVYHV